MTKLPIFKVIMIVLGWKMCLFTHFSSSAPKTWFCGRYRPFSSNRILNENQNIQNGFLERACHLEGPISTMKCVLLKTARNSNVFSFLFFFHFSSKKSDRNYSTLPPSHKWCLKKCFAEPQNRFPSTLRTTNPLRIDF